MSSAVIPDKFTATLVPGIASSTLEPCVCNPRILERLPEFTISTCCPTTKGPSLKFPVTIVPNPSMLKVRSIDSRGCFMSRGVTILDKFSLIIAFRSFSPSPVFVDTVITEAFCKKESFIVSLISSLTKSTISFSTRSILVIAIAPMFIFSSSRIAICSRV